jgi:hypothetical protein
VRAADAQPLDRDAEGVRELGRCPEIRGDVLRWLERPVAQAHAERAERHLDHVGDDQRLAALDGRVDGEGGGAGVERDLERREQDRPGCGWDDARPFPRTWAPERRHFATRG